MAYSVAFFGVSWPDRVIKSRLFKWIMRGPGTASATLAFITIVRSREDFFHSHYYPFGPITVVAIELLMAHYITFDAYLSRRWSFYGSDRGQLELLLHLE